MTNPDLHWFNEARYGLFIHWGPYSVAGRGEWVANREAIPLAEYTERYFTNFRAERYDPAEWARLAKDAGMGYVVLTTRHHDGFCLWDTQTTEFQAARIGPQRDLIRPYVEAVRAAGLKVGLYYSFADWFHPDYPGAYERDWPAAWPDEAGRQRFVRYCQAQLRELMTGYGPIDMLWYDGCFPGPTDGEETNRIVRELQPHILINNRNGDPSDFVCCEQSITPAGPGVSWEACMTLNENWGYHAGDNQWKSPKAVLRLLLQTAAGGGNLLLNVGPRGDGTVPEASAAILRQAGAWLRTNGEFLAHSSISPFTWTSWGRMTTKGHRIYLHIFNPTGPDLCVADIKNKVHSARRVDDGTELVFRQEDGRFFVEGLSFAKESLVTTVVLEVDGDPSTSRPQTFGWSPGA